MASALGLDWETSCAASRCGISRAGILDHCRVQAGDPWEVEFVVGHQSYLLTRGFEAKGRLLRLLAGAMQDLVRGCSEIVQKEHSLPFYLAVPDPLRILTNSELILDKDTREEMRIRRSEIQPPDPTANATSVLEAAAATVNWPGGVRLAAVSQSGHTGMMDVLNQALLDMAAGKSEYSIVGGIDSLLDDETLAWLHNTQRLKNPAFAAGLIPGEAGVLFLLRPSQIDDRRLATVDSLAFDRDSQPFAAGQAPLGRGLASVIRQVFFAPEYPSHDPTWVLSDHNGEAYTAGDWGCALHRLAAAHPAFSSSVAWYPAVSFGETGSAFPAVAATCAIGAWQRGYAPSNRSYIVACSDDGARAALVLTAPASANRYAHG